MPKRVAEEQLPAPAAPPLREAPTLDSLPCELLRMIACFAGPSAYGALTCVNQQFHDRLCTPYSRRISRDQFLVAVTEGDNEWTYKYTVRADTREKHGIQELYLSGDYVQMEQYRSGRKHGAEATFNSQTGTLAYACYWIDGKKHGTEKEWNECGVRRHTTNWCNGEKHGIEEELDNDFRTQAQWEYGKKHGTWKRVNNNGVLIWRCQYMHGQKCGTEEEWDDDSADSGRKHDLSESWDEESGRPLSRCNWDCDMIHCIETMWDDFGEIASRYCFEHGQKHGVGEKYRVVDRFGLGWGNLDYRRNYRRGLRHGIEEGLTDDGVRVQLRHWKDGVLHGLCEEWDDNGTCITRFNVKNGKKCGTEKRWHENGTCIYACRWRNGKKHGTEAIWSKCGTLESKCQWKFGKQHDI